MIAPKPEANYCPSRNNSRRLSNTATDTITRITAYMLIDLFLLCSLQVCVREKKNFDGILWRFFASLRHTRIVQLNAT